MLLSLVYFVLRRLLQALASSGRSDVEREVELLVLRHQVKVLLGALAGRCSADETECCSPRRAGFCPKSGGGRSS